MRLEWQSIDQLKLNLNCRDEIIPILEALKHVFRQSELRDQLIQFVAVDVNESTRDDVGREGLDYWQIVFLAVVRLGCNLDYDKLQDLCENHRVLRCLLCTGDWDETNFASRRIRDTLYLLKPATIEKMNQIIQDLVQASLSISQFRELQTDLEDAFVTVSKEDKAGD